MNSYELSRDFVDFSFENPSIIKPNHYALYFFSIEHCNRLGWKKEFGLPTTMTMEAIGIKSYNTYIKTFNDLVEFGFFKIIERSKNQYSSNIIELSNFNKALDKALDKAFIKHATKQSESIVQSTSESIDSINKPINKEPIKPINNLNIIPQNQKNDFKAEVDLSEIEVIDEECLVGDAHWGTKLKVVEEKEKSSEKKEKEFSSEVSDCYSECLGYFDPSLHPKKKDIYYWLDTIEKLNRLEHLPFSDIVLIVKKAREDEFWSKNFLSLTKLRRKDKDKIPYWRVFVEKFKNTSPNVKLQKMNAGEIIKSKYGL